MSNRFHAFDAARAAALSLGVLLHTAMLFRPANLPQAVARLSPDSIAFVFGFYFIHIFRMPVFFLMAGFLGRRLLARRGLAGFVRSRLVRILVPLVAGWVVFYPPIFAAHMFRIWLSPRTSAAFPSHARGLWQTELSAFDGWKSFAQRFPLAHLWFLYYLLLMYGLVLTLRWLARNRPAVHRAADTVFRAVLESRYGAVCFAAPLAIALVRTSNPYGLDAPDHGFLGHYNVLFAYSSFFLIGWLFSCQPDLLHVIERRTIENTTAGVVVAAWPLVLLARAANPATPQLTALGRVSHHAAYGLAMVLLTFGFLGIFLRWMPQPHPAIRYLSDSAYWVYLAHLPVVLAFQAASESLPVHWAVRLTMTVAISFALLLVTYHYLVRDSWVGVILHGSRRAVTRVQVEVPVPADTYHGM